MKLSKDLEKRMEEICKKDYNYYRGDFIPDLKKTFRELYVSFMTSGYLANAEEMMQEENGIRKAADLYWLARYYSIKSTVPEVEQEVIEKSQIYAGYDPFKSKNRKIRKITGQKPKRIIFDFFLGKMNKFLKQSN